MMEYSNKTDASKKEKLTKILLTLEQWYRKNSRDLPWRSAHTPYGVWVSEIMLQQTRIAAAIPYYERFMAAFPDVKALALAKEEQVLKLWEGLGYYSRARNLKKAAEELVERSGDGPVRFPQTAEEWEKLPGIGTYTAGAIASIAFEKPAAAVDGNVMRVFARLSADERDVMQLSVRKEISEDITKAHEELLSREPDYSPGMANAALMELGEILCVPKGELSCEICPVKSYCEAFRKGETDRYPVRLPRIKRTKEQWTILIIRDSEGRMVVMKRPEKGLLAGLYQPPALSGFLSKEELSQKLKELCPGLVLEKKLGKAKHQFTHKDWEMEGVQLFLPEEGKKKMPAEWILADQRMRAQGYAVPKAFSYFIEDQESSF